MSLPLDFTKPTAAPSSPPPIHPSPAKPKPDPSPPTAKLASSEGTVRSLQRDLEAAKYSASQMRQELEEVGHGALRGGERTRLAVSLLSSAVFSRGRVRGQEVDGRY
jgi:hypothetical protein